MRTVRMTNSDLPEQTIEVPESAVPIHMASGWTATTEGNPFDAAANASGGVSVDTTTNAGPEAYAAAAGDAPTGDAAASGPDRSRRKSS